MKTILITGAAGDIGKHLRQELAGQFALRLSDRRPLRDLGPGETFVRADLTKLADMVKASKGVDAVVHMGGYSVEGPWEAILAANIVGAYNTFEAARKNGVKRFLFASTNHVTGFYPREQTIDHRAYPKPDTRYGASKVFGEQLGSLYADKYGLEVMCLRIGGFAPAPPDKRRLSMWTSPRDLAQLVRIGVDHPDIRFEIVYGISGNTRSWYDNENAYRLGYRPQDNAESHAAVVLAREEPASDPRIQRYQGGSYVTAELVPNPAGPPPAPRRRLAKRPAAKPKPPATRRRKRSRH